VKGSYTGRFLAPLFPKSSGRRSARQAVGGPAPRTPAA